MHDFCLLSQVLEQIFCGATLRDLRNYRLVCREWNNAATKCLQGRLGFIAIGCRNCRHDHSIHYHNLVCNSLPRAESLSESQTTPQPFTPAGSAAVDSSSSSSSSPSSPISSLSTSSEVATNGLVPDSVNEHRLEKFLQVISLGTNPPFTKFEVVPSFFIPKNQQILQRFFQFSSSFIQVLKISLENRDPPDDFDVEFLANISFPKLRSVIFEVRRKFQLASSLALGSAEQATADYSELQNNAVSYRILSTISLGAYNLESLEVSLQRKCEGDGLRRFNLDGTPNFERDRRAGRDGGGTCPCQHFQPGQQSRDNNPSPGLFPILPNNSNGVLRNNDNGRSTTESGTSPSSSSSVKCHLPLPLNEDNTIPPKISSSPELKRLHLRLRNSFIHQDCITSLLERLANTLEELCITEEGHGSRVAVNFPRMKRLSKLTISSICEFEQNFVTVLPFSYSERLPRLTCLDLWDCFGTEKRYEQLLISEAATSQSLKKLVFPSQFRNVTLVQNVPTVFPNLKSLTLVFSTRTENLAVIETVFQNYGESLEELHLITDMNIQNQNVDHVLTGLPKEICTKMKMEDNYVLPLYLQGMERKASLINLKGKCYVFPVVK